MGFNFEQADEVVRELRRLAMAQRGRKLEMLRDLGLQPGQDVVLLELARLGQASQIELAGAAEVDEPSIGRSIVRLERKGLLTRTVDPHDSRRRVVELTPAGKALVPRLKQIYIRFAAEAAGEPGGAFHRRLVKLTREASARFR